MRIAVLVGVFAALAIGASGCGSNGNHNTYPPAEAGVEAQAVTTDASYPAAGAAVGVQALLPPPCPMRWFCDEPAGVYVSKQTCQTVCGVGMCYREAFCKGNCTCP